jgi:hypothetical protein
MEGRRLAIWAKPGLLPVGFGAVVKRKRVCVRLCASCLPVASAGLAGIDSSEA